MHGRTVEAEETRTVEDIGIFDFGSRRFYDVFVYCASDDIPERCNDGTDPSLPVCMFANQLLTFGFFIR